MQFNVALLQRTKDSNGANMGLPLCFLGQQGRKKPCTVLYSVVDQGRIKKKILLMNIATVRTRSFIGQLGHPRLGLVDTSVETGN